MGAAGHPLRGGLPPSLLAAARHTGRESLGGVAPVIANRRLDAGLLRRLPSPPAFCRAFRISDETYQRDLRRSQGFAAHAGCRRAIPRDGHPHGRHPGGLPRPVGCAGSPRRGRLLRRPATRVCAYRRWQGSVLAEIGSRKHLPVLSILPAKPRHPPFAFTNTSAKLIWPLPSFSTFRAIFCR